jgi:L-histidine Nalpha-methyltransferase
VSATATAATRRAFADDVEYYLSQTPRQLPSRYLYDDLGSALFDAICRLPWYPITRAEQSLLVRHGDDVFARLGDVSRVAELGPGGGAKLATLLARRPRKPLAVHLIDISPAALNMTEAALAPDPALEVVRHETTYEAGLRTIAREPSPRRTLVLFLGSNIGNFDPPGAAAFLQGLRSALAPGDALLIGTDLLKPEADLVLAYDDPLGVTAAFNRNLLVRVNRELDGNFDVLGFDHRAVWNAGASRIEMHLVSRYDQSVQVPAARLDLRFAAGETIWTESSYKFTTDGVARLLDQAGLRTIEQWTADTFALTLAEAS